MKKTIIEFLSKLVFAIGCVAVAIYTRIHDLFLPKKEGLTMDCSFLYPNDAQAMEAAGNLVHMAVTPADRDLACVVHCGWTVLGYGLSKGLPEQPLMFAPPDLEACYSMIATELHPCLPSEGMQSLPTAINWTKVIQLVKFLLDLLGS